MSKLILFIKQSAFFLVYYISFLFPRNKKVWLYGNFKGSFRDNSKYLYLFCSEHYPEIEHIWVTPEVDLVQRLQSLGLKNCYKYSTKALLYALKAKVYIYNIYPTTDIYNGSFRGSAFMFNLWHGVPYKKIEYDVKTGPMKTLFNPETFSEKLECFLREPKTFKRSTGVLATSKKLVPIYSSALQLPESKVFVGPYPRNSMFALSKQQLESHISKVESPAMMAVIKDFKKYKKVVIYMPTWRDDATDFMSLAISDFEKLNNVCMQYDVLFAIKAHHLTYFAEDVTNYSHITRLDSSLDMYPVLPFTDALVSDYSSIIFDYSLLKKKIIFYAFDKQEYLSKSREAYFEYEEVFSSDITKDFEGLLSQIAEVGTSNHDAVYDYPLSSSFLDNNGDMHDIVAHIKQSINYR